jgi:hypothetical protein
VQGQGLDETLLGARQPVELRAVGQGREGIEQVTLGVAVEVPFAGESAPTGKDDQGDHLALGKRGLRSGLLCCGVGLAEVVHADVECGEEGVHIEHWGRFLSLRDRVASRL